MRIVCPWIRPALIRGPVRHRSRLLAPLLVMVPLLCGSSLQAHMQPVYASSAPPVAAPGPFGREAEVAGAMFTCSTACEGDAPAPMPVSQGRMVVFIHGINGDATAIASGTAHNGVASGYGRLLSALSARLGVQNVAVFSYFQDRADSVALPPGATRAEGQPRCATIEPIPPTVASDPGHIPVQLPGDAFCDSQGDSGLSAYKLDSVLQSIAAAHHGPVTVVAHSLGGAIARGWLSLASRNIAACEAAGMRADACTAQYTRNVDDVTIFQGATEGSIWAGGNDVLDRWTEGCAGPILALRCAAMTALGDSIRTDLALNPARPAITELGPGSSWYRVINAIAPPPSIHYFNFYSDIRFREYTSPWSESPDIDLGDLVLLPGSDNPFDAGALRSGGAMFRPSGPGYVAHEWKMVDQVTLNPLDQAQQRQQLRAAAPLSHFQLSGRLDQVILTDCRSGSSVSVLREIVAVAGDPTFCSPSSMP